MARIAVLDPADKLAVKHIPGHAHSASDMSGLLEVVQDAVAGLVSGGDGISIFYDDEANSLVIEATPNVEGIRSVLAGTLMGDGRISVYTDPDTGDILISTTATANRSDEATDALIELHAPLASPQFTGEVSVPTPTSPTSAANKAYVDGVVGTGGGGTATSTGPDLWLPAVATAQTIKSRVFTPANQTLTSGTMRLAGLTEKLKAGVTYNAISFVSGSVAATTPTRQWFSIVRASDGVILAVTTDDTTTAWAANTRKELNLTASYTPSVDTTVYLGCTVVAATPNNLVGHTGNAGIMSYNPPVAANSGTTYPGAVPAVGSNVGTLAGVADLPYAYITTYRDPNAQVHMFATSSLTVDATVVPAETPVLVSNSFEGIPNGTTVTVANSGGASGTAFNSINSLSSGQTLIADSARAAHGSRSLQIASGSTAASAHVTWSTAVGTQTTIYARFYLYMTAHPPDTTTMFRALLGTATGAALNMDTSGAMRMQNASGSSTVVGTLPSPHPLNQWVRYEIRVVAGTTNGVIELRRYDTADAPVGNPSTSLTASPATLTATFDGYRFGQLNSIASAGPFWMDDLAVNLTTWCGPAS